MARTTRILVADDMPLIRHLLVQQLSMQPDFAVLGSAVNGREAVELAERLHPDVVVMDVDMPLMNGINATAQIAARDPRVRVILLTVLGSMGDVGNSAGAAICLSKSCTPAQLIDTIRRVREEEVAPAERTTDQAGLTAAVDRLAREAGLTDREKAACAKAVSTDLSVAEIAHLLTQESGEPVTISAVKHALERTMTKLHIEPRTRAALVRHVMRAAAPAGQKAT